MSYVSLGNGVISIGCNAFYGCDALNDYYCYATTPPDCECNLVFSINDCSKLYVPSKYGSKYKSADGWCKFTNIIEMN